MYSPIWWILAVGLAIFKFREELRTYFRCVWLALRLPGPPATPLIGHAHWGVDSKRILGAGETLPKEYGSIIRAWISIFPVVVLFDPTDIQKVLSNSKNSEKLHLYKMLHSLLGQGLITSGGDRWRSHRRLIHPMFKLTNLENFITVFTKGATHLVQNIKQKIGSGNNAVNLVQFVNELVINVLLEAALGVPMNTVKAKKIKEESPYKRGTNSSTLLQRILKPWLMFPTVYQITAGAQKEVNQNKQLMEFTKQAMYERRKILSSDPSASSCFLDYLMRISDENPDFTEEDSIQEACTLMLAGQDSVGSALAFTLHLLANHPEAQDMAVIEQQSIFGDSDRVATVEDIQRMSYLECCVKEALRLYPSVPLIGRTLGEDVNIGKWTLPKGCQVLISPYATHRLAGVYPEPRKFDPQRFDPKNIAARPPYSFLPFSAGPRNCIGYKFTELEIKAALSAVLREFQLGSIDGKDKVSLSFRVTLRASGGLWATFTPRTLLSNS